MAPRPVARTADLADAPRHGDYRIPSTWTAVALLHPGHRAAHRCGAAPIQPLRSLGPDLLAGDFDPDEGIDRLRLRDREELGSALLDQRAVAGIGNVYKSEVAFLERLDPWSRVATFSDDQLRAALTTARRSSSPTWRAVRARRPDEDARRSAVGLPPIRATVPALRICHPLAAPGRATTADVVVPACQPAPPARHAPSAFMQRWGHHDDHPRPADRLPPNRPNRELKWALERAWSGQARRGRRSPPGSPSCARRHLAEQRELIGSAVDDFFLYDEVLETALMLGIAPDRDARRIETDPFGVLTALARGTPEREAWEMTKWFDTNYHYRRARGRRGRSRALRPLPWREPTGEPDATWPILGPYTPRQAQRSSPRASIRAELARAGGAATLGLGRAQAARDPGFRLQVDEPCLGHGASTMTDRRAPRRGLWRCRRLGSGDGPDRDGPVRPRRTRTASRRSASSGSPSRCQLDACRALAGTPAWDAQPEHVVAVMDGRSVVARRASRRVRDALPPLDDEPHRSASCRRTSLMFLPYTVEGEDLPAGFQFAREKARALAAWPAAIAQRRGSRDDASAAAAIWPGGRRAGATQRRAPNVARRRPTSTCPPYPTTTTGSLPQTTDVRQLRVPARAGASSSEPATTPRSAELITDAIALAGARWASTSSFTASSSGPTWSSTSPRQMDGYHTTRNGWVSSLRQPMHPRRRSWPRRPTISEPMTVARVADRAGRHRQAGEGHAHRPGHDRELELPPAGRARRRACSGRWPSPSREEVGHLVDAGARIIQVDEPAVRERWPLPTEDAAADGARSTPGVSAPP